MGRMLIEAVTMIAFMTLMAICSSCLPQPKHEAVSPDYRLAEAGR